MMVPHALMQYYRFAGPSDKRIPVEHVTYILIPATLLPRFESVRGVSPQCMQKEATSRYRMCTLHTLR